MGRKGRCHFLSHGSKKCGILNQKISPVATNTTRRKSGTIRSTPKQGAPRTQIFDGASVIREFVQSPALDTTRENPFSLGAGIVANPCQSRSGCTASLTKLCVRRVLEKNTSKPSRNLPPAWVCLQNGKFNQTLTLNSE